MCDRVHDRLLPHEGWVLQVFGEEQADERLAFTDKGTDRVECVPNQGRQRALNADTFHHVQLSTVLTLGPFPAHEVDPAARVPT